MPVFLLLHQTIISRGGIHDKGGSQVDLLYLSFFRIDHEILLGDFFGLFVGPVILTGPDFRAGLVDSGVLNPLPAVPGMARGWDSLHVPTGAFFGSFCGACRICGDRIGMLVNGLSGEGGKGNQPNRGVIKGGRVGKVVDVETQFLSTVVIEPIIIGPAHVKAIPVVAGNGPGLPAVNQGPELKLVTAGHGGAGRNRRGFAVIIPHNVVAGLEMS